MNHPAEASLTWKSAATSGSRPMMTNSVSPMPNPPRARAIRPTGMDVLLRNCTEWGARRKLIVASALYFAAQANIAQKDIARKQLSLPCSVRGSRRTEGGEPMGIKDDAV